MFYLIFYRDKKERFLEITEKEKTVSNLSIVLKYLDIRGITHFTNIYWGHITCHTCDRAGDAEMACIASVPSFPMERTVQHSAACMVAIVVFSC